MHKNNHGRGAGQGQGKNKSTPEALPRQRGIPPKGGRRKKKRGQSTALSTTLSPERMEELRLIAEGDLPVPLLEDPETPQDASAPQAPPADPEWLVYLKAAPITVMQQLFVMEYVKDWNATQACIRAGYTVASAHGTAWEIRKNPHIKHAIDLAKQEMLDTAGEEAQTYLKEWGRIALADQGELTQLRRVNCRHCWGGENFYAMETPHENRLRQAEYVKAAAKYREDRDAYDARAEAGGLGPRLLEPVEPEWDATIMIGFRRGKEPNPECPECDGEGEAVVWMEDTRKLSASGRALFAGAKITQNGLEVKTKDQAIYHQMLGKHHGLYEDGGDVNVTLATPVTELDRVYAEGVKASEEGKLKVQGRVELAEKASQEMEKGGTGA